VSTKIYNAYRFKKEKLNEFLEFIDDQILSSILEYGNKLFNNLTEHAIQKALEKKGMKGADFSDLFMRELAFEYYIDKAMESSTRDMMDLSASYNFWIRGDYVYTVAYVENWLYEDFDYPDWVEDFNYWDNTDKPEDVSQKEWDFREEVWEEINNNWDKGRLVHFIMTEDGHRRFELMNYIRDKNS